MDTKKIKSKYKNLKYQHLKKIYDKNLSNKVPQNCKYNKQIKLHNNSKFNICTFNIDDNFAVDLCYKNEHSSQCNAFCPYKSKEILYKEFMEDLRNDQIRATKFKDINMLYWLYPELKFEEFPEESGLLGIICNWFKNLFL